MMRIAINGYGRIGRCIVRALYETERNGQITLAGINERFDLQSVAHLTRYDSTHGTFHKKVSTADNGLQIENDHIRVFRETDPLKLPWKELGIDVVLECSGSYTDRLTAEKHLRSGARKLLFSCPAQPDVDATIVYGLNQHLLQPEHTIVSNASCTTNCISHVIKIINDHFTIENGVITTVHSMMNDQPVIDAYHNPDLRKSRSSSNSIIPVHTALAKGISRVFPQLAGRFTATALRVPTLNVSIMQLTTTVEKACSREELNRRLAEAATGPLHGIVNYTELPLVSCDFNHDPHSATIDGSHTSVSGDTLIQVMAWFDNEWGYANRMLDTARAMVCNN